MERLTLEELNNFVIAGSRAVGKTIISKALTELKEYKKLEQELGCPLEILIKAQTEGFFGQVDDKIVHYDTTYNFVVIDFRLNKLQCAIKRDFTDVITFFTFDYKKTWWLREDKSE